MTKNDQEAKEAQETKNNYAIPILGMLVLFAFFIFQFYICVIEVAGRFDFSVIQILMENPAPTMELVSRAFGGSVFVPLVVAGLMSFFKITRINQRRWKTVIVISIIFFAASALNMYVNSMLR